MIELSIEQRQQLTDYYLGLLTEAEAAEVQLLLAQSSQARDFLQKVESTLEPLKSLPEPQAPDCLLPLTLARVRSVAALEGQPARKRLKLTPQESGSGLARPRILRFPELITIAASIALVVGLLVPAVRQWRRISLRQNCAHQQASIGMGMRNYAAAHNNQLPYISEKVGKDWMPSKGFGSKRTDTSNLFILVKRGYAKPEVFICPAVPHSPQTLQYSIDEQTDFPTESAVSYSYQNMFGAHRPSLDSPPGFAILADRNPLLILGPRPSPATQFLRWTSPNHGSDRGHNVLRLDWSVDWSKTAKVGFRGDNIWQPANFIDGQKKLLHGREVPASSEDSFLGP